MTFIDSNIPMYLIGADHQNKERALQLSEQLILDAERLVTDAEVFQEILHRYVAIERLEAIEPCFTALSELVDEVFAVDFAAVESARDLIAAHSGLSARDAIHVAVMQQQGVNRILSFDRGFDSVSDIERLGD